MSAEARGALDAPAGLTARGRRRFRVTTDSAHALPVAANQLARRFAVTPPNRVWAADITALWTRPAGVIWPSFSISARAGSSAGPSATRSRPSSSRLPCTSRWARARTPQLHHSDRGVSMRAMRYRTLLDAHGITVSMSRVGNCWDNAPVESFFSSLKAELVLVRALVVAARRPRGRHRLSSFLQPHPPAFVARVSESRSISKRHLKSPYDSSTASTKTGQPKLLFAIRYLRFANGCVRARAKGEQRMAKRIRKDSRCV